MVSSVRADADWGIIELYIVFSLITAIVGLVQIYAPVQKRIKEKHTNNLITGSPIFSVVIFVIHGVIVSPLLFAVLMVPSVTNKFIDTLYVRTNFLEGIAL